KITGGLLKVKSLINKDEKVDQIRIYSGNKFTTVDKIAAGNVCAIKGFKNIQAGQGLGFEKDEISPVLSSYMDYRIILPDNCDQHKMLANLQLLAQEDPQLHIVY